MSLHFGWQAGHWLLLVLPIVTPSSGPAMIPQVSPAFPVSPLTKAELSPLACSQWGVGLPMPDPGPSPSASGMVMVSLLLPSLTS